MLPNVLLKGIVWEMTERVEICIRFLSLFRASFPYKRYLVVQDAKKSPV